MFTGRLGLVYGGSEDLVRQEGYTPCVDSTNTLMSTLCAPGATVAAGPFSRLLRSA
jgi:hypothetical protein